MRYRALMSVVLLAACAPSGTSGSSTAPAPATQTIRVGGGGGGGTELRLSGGDALQASTLAFAPDKVWLILPAIFDSLGVSVSTIDPTKRLIGNPSLKVRSRLKSTPLSRYIDCGNSGQIGPNADNYDIVLTVFVNATPAADGATTVTTTFDAVGRPATYAQEYSQCRSTGLFEKRLLELLQAHLQK
jgi:hypothetical protein